MKTIKLHSLTLINWRGEKKRTTTFNDNAPTYILGANGLGKSRHFDAFCWLLFGKDSHDRKDFEIRTYDANHQPLHHCECSVEAVISVDGTEYTIKREYKEQWMKPRGQVEEVFKGNITECTWNSVPVKVSDFQKRIAENIIDETVFKMITNPHFFAEKMKWQLQRETLLQMAGAKTDEEIAADNADFNALLDHLNGKSLSDFRKSLAAEKKRLKAEKDDIEPRIDQTHKLMPEAEDWDALQHEKDDAKKQLQDIQQQLDNSADRDKAQLDKVRQLNKRISDIKDKQDELCRQHRLDTEKEAAQKNEARRNIEQKCKEIATSRSDNNIDIAHAKERMEYLHREVDNLAPQLEQLRKMWYKISAMQYDGSDICPHCGQRLPENMIADAKSSFEEHRKTLLQQNSERGKSLSSQQKSFMTELNDKSKALKALQDAEYDKQLKDLYDQLAKHPVAKPAEFNNEDVPGWTDMDNDIQKLEKEVEALSTPQDDNLQKTVLCQKRDNLQKTINDLQARLMKRSQIDTGKEEITKLQARGNELAQLIADIEQREYTAAQFSKKRIEDCEARINSMFQLVRFQLFDYTQDGNEFETCMPIVNGVPYAVANTASQLNAGLDIINTLCRFNKVSAPIFCDGAESVNNFIPTNSQMIFLSVTTDNQLVIK